MANKNNNNQPRRKRNKKPVKRYSEEYTNRPNPYTGYSADGNFHPEAKKHTLDDASVAADSAAVPDIIEQEQDVLDNGILEMDSAKEVQNDENKNVGGEKVSSHRKKNIDRAAEKKAQQAKQEARKATVSKIAQGVAAHSVSEQIIEDIASMSDVMENMAKANSDKTEAEDIQSVGTYDDLTSSEQVESDSACQENTNDDAADFEIALPVVLGDDDVLPFDIQDDENSDQSEEESQPVDEESSSCEVSDADDSVVIPPLNPADLIPVLDFDKPSAPVLNFDKHPENESVVEDNDGDSHAEQVSAVTIQEILEAVEKENLGSHSENTISESREISFGSDMIFDTEKSEEWDSIIVPPYQEPTEVEDTFSPNQNEELEKLLEACFKADDEVADVSNNDDEDSCDIFAMSDDADVAADELSQLNEYTSQHISDITDDISEITAEAFGDGCDDNTQGVENAFDIAEGDIVETALEVSEIVSADDNEDADSELDATEAAVNAKLQKLVEAAELAELLRMENVEAVAVTDEFDHCEKSYDDVKIAVEDSDNNEIPDEPDSDEECDDIKEYSSKAACDQSEKIFESVLIVDEACATSADEADNQDDTLFLRAKNADECPTAVFKLPEGPIILPTEFDDADFREQWLDDEEDSDEMASRSKRARRRISAFIGAVTILFVLVGAVWVLKTAVMGINSIGSTGEKKAEYTQFISPVVITDPKPFESVENADNQMLLESAIWSVLDSADDAEDFNYQYDDTGKIVLPAKEVAEAGKKLFGDNVKLEMDVLSETDGNVLYYYNSIEDNFHIATGGIIGPSAVITKIANKSDYVSLIVGYCSQADINSAASDQVEAYKYMEYILSFDEKGSYYIESIRDYTEE